MPFGGVNYTADSSESDHEVTALCHRSQRPDLYAGTASGLLGNHGPTLRLFWRDMSRGFLFSFGEILRGLHCLWTQEKGRFSARAMPICCGDSIEGPKRRSWLVFILLFLSGNVHPNPGPALAQFQTPD